MLVIQMGQVQANPKKKNVNCILPSWIIGIIGEVLSSLKLQNRTISLLIDLEYTNYSITTIFL